MGEDDSGPVSGAGQLVHRILFLLQRSARLLPPIHQATGIPAPELSPLFPSCQSAHNKSGLVSYGEGGQSIAASPRGQSGSAMSTAERNQCLPLRAVHSEYRPYPL